MKYSRYVSWESKLKYRSNLLRHESCHAPISSRTIPRKLRSWQTHKNLCLFDLAFSRLFLALIVNFARLVCGALQLQVIRATYLKILYFILIYCARMIKFYDICLAAAAAARVAAAFKMRAYAWLEIIFNWRTLTAGRYSHSLMCAAPASLRAGLRIKSFQIKAISLWFVRIALKKPKQINTNRLKFGAWDLCSWKIYSRQIYCKPSPGALVAPKLTWPRLAWPWSS